MIPFTPQKYQQLQTEHDRLVKLREEVMGRLQTAREMGDLSENGAYKYAKFELGNIQRQLREITFLLQNGHSVEPITSNTIQFGSQVTITNVQTKKQLSFLLVSKYESDPKQNKLSINSPIGEAIFGKKVGEKVVAKSPTGEQEFLIESVA